MVKPAAPSPPPDEARARLLVSVPAGKIVFREGERGEEMYIIEDGEIEIVKLHGPVERALSTLGPGDFFGEMSLLEGQPRVATAKAKSDAKLLPIDASTFDQLLRENPEITIRMMRRLSQRLRRYEEEEAKADAVAQQVLGGISRADMPNLAPVSVTSDAPVPAPRAVVGWLLHLETGKSFPVAAGRDSTVGRYDPVTELSPDVDLLELDTQRSTSRRHARISERGGAFYVREEIGTANGTYVGADRLQTGVERELHDGDAVRFGRVDFQFRVVAG
jgi:CRP-like cAMP-binding protein